MISWPPTPIPVIVIGKGKGLAVAVIDYGLEHSLIWIVALDEGGEIWCARNEIVRFRKNWTAARTSLLDGKGTQTSQRVMAGEGPRLRHRPGIKTVAKGHSASS